MLVLGFANMFPDSIFKCDERALQGEKYCVLHIDFPKDKQRFERISKMKAEKVVEKIRNGDFFFMGAKLDRVIFNNLEIQAIDITFDYATLSFVAFDNVHAILKIVLVSKMPV